MTAMRRLRKSAGLLSVATLALLLWHPGALEPRVQAQSKRAITEADILKFVWIADPQMSPDGTQVAFVRVVVNEKTDDYETSLYLVPADGGAQPRKITSGTHDAGPRWSPDGRRIAFTRPAGGASQVFVLNLSGGEAQAVTNLARGASAPMWAPDGKRIAFSSSWKSEDDQKPDPNAAPKSDVRIITEAQYRNNGGGWAELDRPSHIWVTDLAANGSIAKPKQLTAGAFSESAQAWTNDGSRILFTSTRVEEAYYYQNKSELFAVPSAGGEFVKVASINGGIGNVRVSPDGKRLAFVASINGAQENSYDQTDLFVASSDGTGTPKNLTDKYDFDINGSIGGDQSAPRGGRAAGPVWSPDGSSILIVSGEQGDANLVRVDASTGAVSPVIKGKQAVQQYSVSSDGHSIVALISNQTEIGDLYAGDPTASTVNLRQIAQPNDALFKQLNLSNTEEFWYTSFDGKKIQGWIMTPPNFDRTKKYPLILQIHGGPHSAYGNVFTHEFHMMAARGYVVLFTNPRGSSNYGQEFGNIIQYHYPGDDYKDLMAGVDELLKRGYVDADRLGVTGGSGGGLLTDWTVTQTTRFKAAVAQRDIADWYGFWFTADFTQFTPSWFRKAPWEDPEDYAARSPITHVANVKTPMMFILGDADLRTPPANGGEMMFRALKYMKIPTTMVRFPGETHELSRSGKPQHRIVRLNQITGWMDRWLKK
jgi:dipeptidyl aminopeptidase/acylaminoacyl peptidase